MEHSMKVAYITTYDSSDIRNWSGTGFYIRQALERQGNEIIPIGNLGRKKTPLMALKERYYSKFLKKQYIFREEPSILKSYARQVEKRLKHQDHDLIFCPHTYPIAYLKTKKPIAIWLDSTFATIKDYYIKSANIAEESMRKGNLTSQLAFDKTSLIIFASDWSLNEAKKHYLIDPKKLVSIPFGANLECDRTLPEIEALIDSKSRDICKLLFIGVDWERKGGDVALKVVELLNNMGVQTELHIVGCDPEGSMPTFVVRHGFIPKNTVEGQKKLDQLFSEAHFFILPTQAEMFGVVFAEASSWGVPSIATNTGGVPSAVRDGINGFTLDVNADPEEYAELIEKCFLDKSKYREIALSSFQEYQDRLNWDVSGQVVNELLMKLLEKDSKSQEKIEFI